MTAKTPEQEAAYMAGRQDAQILCNLALAGTKVKAPDITSQQYQAHPIDDWHEDDGPVVWWRFPVDEPAWIGTPNDSDWPGYHTHWTAHPPLPKPRAPES